MIMYDLKASNLVVDMSRDDEVNVRLIDYGNDFCEWSTEETRKEIDCHTPVLDRVHKLCDSDPALMHHIVFSVMFVQLSSTLTQHLYKDRREHRMGHEERERIHPLRSLCEQHLESMTGKNKSILCDILRAEGIRAVLRHYHGRRWSGTKRTLECACGEPGKE